MTECVCKKRNKQTNLGHTAPIFGRAPLTELRAAANMSIQVGKYQGSAPTQFLLDNKHVPLYTFQQLDVDKRKAAKVAMATRDALGGFATNYLPPLPLANPDGVIYW